MTRLLDEKEAGHYHREGWVVPRFRLPSQSTSVFERDLRPAHGKTGVPVDFAQRPLWLVHGVDRSGRNDFVVGHRNRSGLE